jgi:hypothetical protein
MRPRPHWDTVSLEEYLIVKFPEFARWMRLSACALAGVVSCKPSVGSSCEVDESRCLDQKTQLACDKGQFIATPCRGPAGCAANDQGVRCDISGNQQGDACSFSDEGAASCVGGQRMVVCRSGKYVFAECRGAKGCANAAGRAVCDTSLAADGDGCNKESAKACSTDGKQILSCKSGKMSSLLACRGDAACVAEGSKLNCDMSVARVGDVCDKTMDGKNACDEKRLSILVCRNGQFAFDEKCRANTACAAEGGSISCKKRDSTARH